MCEIKNQKNEDSVISIEEIQAILTEYCIGKKPLAKLLGWGETTIIRYIEGDVPTLEYSDKLKSLLYNPCYYYDILMKNRENLTGVAFKKSKKAVLDRLMSSKINIVCQYLINKNQGEITPLYIQHLLYYIQGFSLAIYDKEMFSEEYYINGNVPYAKIYTTLKKRGVTILEMTKDALDEEEKALIDQVDDSFGWYGQRTLAEMISHEKALLRISRDKDNNKIIAKEAMRNLFRELQNQYGIKSIQEISKYPNERIVEIRNLTS